MLELDPDTGEILLGEELGPVGGSEDLADEVEDRNLERQFLFKGQRSSFDIKSRQDLYETPFEATQSIVEVLINGLADKNEIVFYDPACGNNAIVDVFTNNGLSCIGTDLFTQKVNVDFLKDELPQYDFLITNPPFNMSSDFLVKAYNSGKAFLMLLPIDCIGTKNKYLLFHKYGVIVYCIFPKPKFLHEGKHVQVNNCAWFYGNSGLVSKGEIIMKSCGLNEIVE